MNDIPRFWSVTTLLSLAVAKPAFVHAAAKTVAETAVDRLGTLRQMVETDEDRQGAVDFLTGSRWRKRAKILNRGSKVHAAAEELNKGVAPEDLLGGKVPPEALPYIQQYQRFLNEHRPDFLLAEAPIYNTTLGYAGTLDAVIQRGGEAFVLDVKTTERDLSEAGGPPYPDIAFQIAAYSRADTVAIQGSKQINYNSRRYYALADDAQLEPMPKVSQATGLVLVLSPADYRYVPVRIDEEVWGYFLVAMDMAKWELQVASRVVGTPITPPAVAMAAA